MIRVKKLFFLFEKGFEFVAVEDRHVDHQGDTIDVAVKIGIDVEVTVDGTGVPA